MMRRRGSARSGRSSLSSTSGSMARGLFFSAALAASTACGGPTAASIDEAAAAPAARLLEAADRALIPVVETRFQMGTLVRIAIAADDDPEVRAAIDRAFAAIDAVIGIMSEWEPDSDVSRVNAAAGSEAVAVDPSLIGLIETAESISVASRGAFDLTWAALRGLWCFEPECAEVPDAGAVAEALRRVDYRRVEVDRAAGTVLLPDAGMALGLGGIAKGYSIARAADVLRAAGLDDFVIDAGGDVYAAGTRFGEAWEVGIADPRGSDLLGTIAVSDAVVVTSGDYERYFERDGIRYHHIIDVRTGMPARGLTQVTVLAEDPTVADALATAAFVLGASDGLALIDAWEGAEGFLVDEVGGHHRTAGWPLLVAVIR